MIHTGKTSFLNLEYYETYYTYCNIVVKRDQYEADELKINCTKCLDFIIKETKKYELFGLHGTNTSKEIINHLENIREGKKFKKSLKGILK